MRTLLIASLFLASCTSTNPQACAPGAQSACACLGGTSGIQVCKDDGSGFKPCAGCPAQFNFDDMAMSGGAADMAGADTAAGDPCGNGVKDGNETDVDCGGDTCPRCGAGKMCLQPGDCTTNRCTANKCVQGGALQNLSFAPPIAYGGNMNPVSVATGFFDADKKTDLVVANQMSGDVSVLLGKGDGTFGAPMNSAAGMYPNFIVAGDFNNDQRADVAVPNGKAFSGGTSGQTAALIGKGDGSLGAPALYNTPGPNSGWISTAATLSDLNGDKHPDITIVSYEGNNYNGRLTILLGTANGTFQMGSDMPIPPSSSLRAVATGDFNKDGKLDVLIGPMQDGAVHILLGNGDGTVQNETPTQSGKMGVSAIAAGDFNADGKLDFAVAGQTVNVLLGKGDGTFQAPVVNGAGGSPSSLAIADLNLDGKLDIVCANQGSANVTILLGKGDGTFPTSSNFLAGKAPISVAVSDFNGDGKPDLAVADTAVVDILLNTSQ